MTENTAGLNEFELINRYFARPGADRSDVIVGIGDDAAILRLPTGADLVAAVDTIVEGRHFPAGMDARAIGHRALAVNLSDLAAMGATPLWASLALTLPAADSEWLQGFATGFFALAQRHGVALVGGDTTRGALTVSVQLMGHVPAGTALKRNGAEAGDLLVVTGTLGDAGAGLALVQSTGPAAGSPSERELIRRFEYPTPRVEFGLAARGVASAAMDLSDGLVGDLTKFASINGLAGHVEVDRLPVSAALSACAAPTQVRDWALAAGDDYELLLAVPVERHRDLTAHAARLGLALTVIGDLRRGTGVTWSSFGVEFHPEVRGYDHFA